MATGCDWVDLCLYSAIGWGCWLSSLVGWGLQRHTTVGWSWTSMVRWGCRLCFLIGQSFWLGWHLVEATGWVQQWGGAIHWAQLLQSWLHVSVVPQAVLQCCSVSSTTFSKGLTMEVMLSSWWGVRIFSPAGAGPLGVLHGQCNPFVECPNQQLPCLTRTLETNNSFLIFYLLP